MLIEDDAELASYLRVKLSHAGFRVMLSDTVVGGLILTREYGLAAVVASMDLPHGQDIAARLGRVGVPLILLTSLQGGWVPSGNVEVLTKPFLFHVLIDQLRFLHVSVTDLSVGPVRLDVKARVLTVRKVSVLVSAREAELLVLLMRRPGRAFSVEELSGSMWPGRETGPNSLAVLVASVRRKLAEAGQPGFIRTVRGFGYGLNT